MSLCVTWPADHNIMLTVWVWLYSSVFRILNLYLLSSRVDAFHVRTHVNPATCLPIDTNRNVWPTCLQRHLYTSPPNHWRLEFLIQEDILSLLKNIPWSWLSGGVKMILVPQVRMQNFRILKQPILGKWKHRNPVEDIAYTCTAAWRQPGLSCGCFDFCLFCTNPTTNIAVYRDSALPKK